MNTVRHILLAVLGYWVAVQPSLAQSKFAIALSGAPVYQFINFRGDVVILGANNGNPANEHVRQTAQGFSLSLMLRYSISNRISITTGVGANQMHYQLPDIVRVPPLTLNQGTVVGSTNRLYQIPFLFNYQVSTKKLSPYLSLGAVLSFLPTYVSPNGETFSIRNQPLRVFPTLGAGATYQISKPLSLIVQPSLTYIPPSLSFLPDQFSLTSYANYQLGLQVQLLYKLHTR